MTPILTRLGLLCLLSMTLFSSCIQDREEITASFYTPEDYAVLERSLNLPNDRISYQAELAPHMEFNSIPIPELSDTKALLGRVLFYDTHLSRNNAVSCASCHKQELAFADDVAKSKGFDGELTKRNSLALAATVSFTSSYGTDLSGNTLANLPDNQSAFGAGFFWDERARTVADQSRLTIQDDVEMGMNLADLSRKLADVDYYQVLFRKAYGSPAVTEDRILEALQEFVNSFVSTHTKFDEGMNRHNSSGAVFSNFTEQENIGKKLFLENCSSCHGSNMTTQFERVANNGLAILDNDLGVGGVTGSILDRGKFKVPFLRNVALTAPYMHDGRFASLEEVIDHYSENIEMHNNLDFRLRDPNDTNQPMRMNFSQAEKDALLAFLYTLTDNELIYEEKFSDPFIR
ncbi:MAG: cytochrome c peroxidase [Saprospiraceae bacterium]|nr:c-type cytochrome [Lewinella sp.]